MMTTTIYINQLNQHCKDFSCCFVGLEDLKSLGIVSGGYVTVSFTKENGRKEHVIVTAVGCLKDSSMIEEASILMSPISLDKLGISTFHQNNVHVQISVSPTIIYKEISAITISRIAGYKYPENNTEIDIEKMALQSFFSRPQRMAVGDVICVSTSELRNSDKPVSVLMKSFEVLSRRDKDFLFMYLVKEIALNENFHDICSSESSNSDHKNTNCSSKESHQINSNSNSSESHSINSSSNSSSSNRNISGNTNQIDICDENNKMNKDKCTNESGIPDSFLISATARTETPPLVLLVTSRDMTKISLKGLSNCRTFDISMLTDFCHDLYSVPIKSVSQRCHESQGNGIFAASVVSQESLLAPSVDHLVKALSPIISLANDSLDNYKSEIENNQYLDGDNENNYNGYSDIQHSMTDSALYSLITSPLLIECSCGEHGE